MKTRYVTFLLLFIASALFGQKPLALSDSQTEVRKHLFEGNGLIHFLNNCTVKSIDAIDLSVFKKKLATVGFYASMDNFVRIANDTLYLNTPSAHYLFKTKDKLHGLYIEEFENMDQVMQKWKIIQPLQKVYWGYSNYYFKFESQHDVSLNVLFKTKKHIVTIQKILPFKALNYDEITHAQWLMIDQANTDIINTLKILSETLAVESEQIYAPTNGRLYPKPLTSTERMIGFVHFWTEVKYNFAFFSQVPDVNWNDVLSEYLPKFASEQTTYEYYSLMSEVCAKLKDGHTNVYYPIDTRKEMYYPKIILRSFEDGIYVINTSKKYSDVLPLGSKIIAVNEAPVDAYIQNRLYPYISASTQHIKISIALQKLFEFPLEHKLNINYLTPQGKSQNYVFSAEQDTTSWIVEEEDSEPLEFEALKNNIAYLKINTFADEQVLTDFLKIKDTISNFSKLIIDLRENTGGNSGYGYEILRYFSTKPFLTSKWMTREHKPAYKAWGEYVSTPPANEFEEECLLTFKENYWHVAPPDTIEPHLDSLIKIPIVILIGNNTASAAEDFLVAAEGIGFVETVGDLTYGSTGQPTFIRLPGGGTARICTKKDTYPDGKEFVGYGIKPKHTVKPNLQEVLSRRDVVLDFALKLKP